MEREYTSITADYAARLLDCPAIAVMDMVSDCPIIMEDLMWPDGAVVMMQHGDDDSVELVMSKADMAEHDWFIMHNHIDDSDGKYSECFLVAKNKAGEKVLFGCLFIYPKSFAAIDYMLTDVDYHIKHPDNN